MEYRILFNLLILAFVAFMGLTRRMRFIEIIVFLVPFRTIALNIGLSFTAAEVLTIFGVGVLFLVRKPEKIRLVGGVLPYLFYCVISTVFLSLFVVDAIPVKSGNVLREEGRFLVQIVLNILPVYGLLFLIVNHIRNRTELIRAFKAFVLGITILVGLGLVQFLLFKVAGIDMFPLGSYSSIGRTSVYNTIEQLGGWIRICSLAGEPKGLGAITAVGAAVLILAGKFLPETFSSYRIKAWIFAGVLILTLSTGGILLGGLLALTAFSFRYLFSRYNWNLFRASVLLPFFFISVIFARAYSIVFNLVQYRIIQRIVGENEYTGGGIEDFDQTIMAFLNDNPWWIITGSGWGNIHNLSQAYIPPHFAYYMQDTIFVAKSGYLKIISENGLIGFLLLLFFEGVTLLQLYKRFNRGRIYKFFFAVVVVSWVAFMIRSNYVIYEYIILHGLAISLIYMPPDKEKNTKNIEHEKSNS